MASDETQDREEGAGSPEELSPDPFVEKVRPDPSEPPIPVRVLEGLIGQSDRVGYWRLYFSRELDNYAEFRQEDVVFSEPIPSEQLPFLRLDATRVGIRRDATVEFTRAQTPRPVDEFDIDVRLGTAQAAARDICVDTVFTLFVAGCGGGGGGGTGRLDTCVGPICHTRRATDCATCVTDCGDTCNTCQTQCGQPTCPTSPQHTCQTCQTCPGQDTCVTCQTQCGQPTCPTSPQHTCQTCQTRCPGQTCDTRCGQFTCNPTDQACQPTEQRTCFNTRCFTCQFNCQTP